MSPVLNKRFLMLTLILIMSADTLAQRSSTAREMPRIGVLTGRVLDKLSGQPVEYANITLISSRDSAAVTGGISDSEGNFHLTELALGQYDVRFEFIGYEALIIPGVELSPRTSIEKYLGEVLLEPATLEGGTVEVTGDRPLITQTIDKRIFNVEKSLTSEGQSAIEVLEQVPSVDVDSEGTISLRGSSNVRILLDGKPSGLSNEDNSTLLEQIPSSTLESIEIITNPSAKYDPDGMSGIINIVLKKNRLSGLTGSLGSSFADANRWDVNGQLNFREGKLNLSSMLAFRRHRFNIAGTNLMTSFDSSGQIINVLDQSSAGYREFESTTFRLNSDYNLWDLNKLNAGIMISRRRSSMLEDIDYQSGPDKFSIIPSYRRHSDSEDDGNTLTYNIGWDKKFRRDGQELTAEFRQSVNNSVSPGTYLQDGLTDPVSYFERQSTTEDEERRTTTLQMDYVQPFSEDEKLELGLKAIQTDMEYQFSSLSQDTLVIDWTADEDLGIHFIYDEYIYSAYATYGKKIGRFGFQAGVRLEEASSTSDVFTEETFTNTYRSVFPTVNLMYTLAPQKDLQFSYSRRVNRPRTRAVVPVVNYSDPLNLRTGNPNLLPEYIDSYELNYTQFTRGITLTSGLYYRKIDDLIRRYKEIEVVDGETVSVTTYRNFDQGHSFGAESMISARIQNKLRLMLSGNITRTIIDESGLAADINSSSFGHFLRGTVSYTPLPGTDVQFFSMYRSPREIAQGSISSMLFANLAIKHRFWDDHASLSLQLSDLFDSRRFKFTLNTAEFEQERQRIFCNRYLRVNFTYRFGKLVDNNRNGMDGRDDMEIDVGID